MTKNMRNAREFPAIELLDGFPIESIDHFGRPLCDHLVGTWRMLRDWDEPIHLCRAGLFHSIYGTETFPTAAIQRSERGRIRRRIGDRAELLAYLFGMADRRRLLLENHSPPTRWIDHRTGSATELGEAVLAELVTLEVANFLEQFVARPDLPQETVRDMRFRFMVASKWMSENARLACQSTFGDWPHADNDLSRGGTDE